MVRVELNCDGCGGNRFALNEALSDKSQIRCEDCGRNLGTLGELKEQVSKAALSPGPEPGG
jgi:uncharacterized Zn finger protein